METGKTKLSSVDIQMLDNRSGINDKKVLVVSVFLDDTGYYHNMQKFVRFKSIRAETNPINVEDYFDLLIAYLRNYKGYQKIKLIINMHRLSQAENLVVGINKFHTAFDSEIYICAFRSFSPEELKKIVDKKHTVLEVPRSIANVIEANALFTRHAGHYSFHMVSYRIRKILNGIYKRSKIVLRSGTIIDAEMYDIDRQGMVCSAGMFIDPVGKVYLCLNEMALAAEGGEYDTLKQCKRKKIRHNICSWTNCKGSPCSTLRSLDDFCKHG
jgi:hypothetical protein